VKFEIGTKPDKYYAFVQYCVFVGTRITLETNSRYLAVGS